MKQLATVLALLASFSLTSALPAEPRPKPANQLPAGAVRAGEAIRRIAALEDTIENRRLEMSRLYDQDVKNTLTASFRSRGVHQTAYKYIDSWSGDVYLLWVNSVRSYYTKHWEELDTSAKALSKSRRTYMLASDLQSLEDGVVLWRQNEPEVAQGMVAYCEGLAEKAFYLGKAMEITSDSRYFTDTAYHQSREFEVEAHKVQADLAGNIASKAHKQAQERAAQRLFSAVRAGETVATPETPGRRFTIQKLQVSTTNWELRQRELQSDLQQANLQLESTQAVVSGYVKRVDDLLKECDQWEQQKKQIDDQILALTQTRPGPEIPKEARTLYEQKQFTQRSLVQCEDQILASRPSEHPRLFRQRGHLKDQLARIERALREKMPPAPAVSPNPQLPILVEQWWDKRKQHARLLSDLNSLVRLQRPALEDVDRARARIEQLQFQLKQVSDNGLPGLRRITVSADGQIVYQAEWAGPLEPLARKSREVEEMEVAVREFKQVKDEAFDHFEQSSRTASSLLAELHGSSVSQGEGKWATIKDVFSNNGAILWNARRQAGVEFGMNAYEVFVEGWGRGGPIGAVAETMGKLANAATQKGIDEGLEWAGFEDDDPNVNAGDVFKTVVYRAIEDSAIRALRDKIGQTLRVRQARLRIMKERNQSGVLTPQAMQARARRLRSQAQHIDDLRRPERYTRKDLASGVLKDAVKLALTQLSQKVENTAWEAFALEEAAQINFYQIYSSAAAAYWPAVDQLDELRQERAELARGYDPNTGFRTLRSQPFSDKATLTIQVELVQPQGHDETVLLGGSSAGKVSPHRFQLNAANLPKSSGNPTPIEMQVLQQ